MPLWKLVPLSEGPLIMVNGGAAHWSLDMIASFHLRAHND